MKDELGKEELKNVTGGRLLEIDNLYECKDCKYEWTTNDANAKKCPKCKSKNIKHR